MRNLGPKIEGSVGLIFVRKIPNGTLRSSQVGPFLFFFFSLFLFYFFFLLPFALPTPTPSFSVSSLTSFTSNV
ncbi:hypothetical protein BDV38DRAFT_145477 [Aspergillus pseudotamarii]|uniref:Uncharacterized protein n=1 Tax=Aspergillus pseudotamarii TaxID=132259 RepID=A0A5N6SM51_ASPPS|nr:uncharacterized protein BDV38DRAFT_145477 [Aspergillus pseudotamarii]KAE8134959.1 hypothetical protein BDV38DRAFT_145477 [Aspergillus pseudotamarii]